MALAAPVPGPAAVAATPPPVTVGDAAPALTSVTMIKGEAPAAINGDQVTVVEFWATWCGPCIAEFSELVDTYRMFMGRDFEMYTISTDKLDKKDNVKEFLQKKNAALNNNFIFESENKYDLIENFDPDWTGEIPYTVIVEPGGKIVWRSSGSINFLEFRKAIVENPLIGRYF